MKRKKLTAILCTLALTFASAMTVSAKDVGDYADVHEKDWFYSPVADISEKEYMTGTSETTFAPAANLERGQLATILYRMNGNPGTDYSSASRM